MAPKERGEDDMVTLTVSPTRPMVNTLGVDTLPALPVSPLGVRLLGSQAVDAPSSIAARISEILVARKWSQRELARRSGLHPSQVGNVIRTLGGGRTVELLTLWRIAEGAGVRYRWLSLGENPRDGEVSDGIPLHKQGITSLAEMLPRINKNSAERTQVLKEGGLLQDPKPGHETPLETAVFLEMDRREFTAEDFDAARFAAVNFSESQGRHGSAPLKGAEIDALVESLRPLARSLLEAARGFRHDNVPPSPLGIWIRAALEAHALREALDPKRRPTEPTPLG